MNAMMTDFTAKPGAVMTDEVGTVTGELTLRTELGADGAVRTCVQYVGADEWYHVTDAPSSLPPGISLGALHAQVLDGLRA
jgi:hypothetical protein